MTLGHMFLLCGARPYVSIMWRSAICFYWLAVGVGLGHMFLLVGCGRGAGPYVSIMWRWAICFYWLAAGLLISRLSIAILGIADTFLTFFQYRSGYRDSFIFVVSHVYRRYFSGHFQRYSIPILFPTLILSNLHHFSSVSVNMGQELARNIIVCASKIAS